jgi:outer membrane protein assembly factor BamD (BamD/ComL family)
MMMFAKAELLLFQNKEVQATRLLDTITYLFPGHALYDDIEYTKAQIFVKRKEFERAIPLLEDIIKNYKTDLKGDDATFLLAQINEQHLSNNYNSSLLVIEARKRFRTLRGDNLSE